MYNHDDKVVTCQFPDDDQMTLRLFGPRILLEEVCPFHMSEKEELRHDGESVLSPNALPRNTHSIC